MNFLMDLWTYRIFYFLNLDIWTKLWNELYSLRDARYDTTAFLYILRCERKVLSSSWINHHHCMHVNFLLAFNDWLIRRNYAPVDVYARSLHCPSNAGFVGCLVLCQRRRSWQHLQHRRFSGRLYNRPLVASVCVRANMHVAVDRLVIRVAHITQRRTPELTENGQNCTSLSQEQFNNKL